MLMALLIWIISLHRRAGGLEKTVTEVLFLALLHRRAGGLEKKIKQRTVK